MGSVKAAKKKQHKSMSANMLTYGLPKGVTFAKTSLGRPPVYDVLVDGEKVGEVRAKDESFGGIRSANGRRVGTVRSWRFHVGKNPDFTTRRVESGRSTRREATEYGLRVLLGITDDREA